MSLWQRPYGPQNGAANSAAQTSLNQQAQGVPVLPALQVIEVTSEVAIVNPSQPTADLLCTLPPNLPATEQIPFDCEISGYIKTTENATVTLRVYEGTTLGSGTKIADSGAVTQNNATAPFEAHLHLLYDSVSGKLTGTSEFLINNTIVAKTALVAVVTGISNSSNPVLSLLLSLQASAASGSDPVTINVENFSIG